MSYQVYKLVKYDDTDNRYNVSRREIWDIKKLDFNTKDEAVEYCKEQERRNPEFINLTSNLDDIKSLNFLTKFILDDLYFLRRKTFLFKNPKQKLIELLKKDKINVMFR